MANMATTLNSIKFVERMLMGLTFVALLVHYIFAYQPTFFMAIFALGLALVYFPFGFYFIGKPSQYYTYTIPVLLGFIYALGISTLLISAVNIDSYRYPLIAGFFVLLALVIYLVVKLRSAYYPAIFVNAQFIRIGFIILTNLIVLLK